MFHLLLFQKRPNHSLCFTFCSLEFFQHIYPSCTVNQRTYTLYVTASSIRLIRLIRLVPYPPVIPCSSVLNERIRLSIPLHICNLSRHTVVGFWGEIRNQTEGGMWMRCVCVVCFVEDELLHLTCTLCFRSDLSLVLCCSSLFLLSYLVIGLFGTKRITRGIEQKTLHPSGEKESE